MSNTAQSAASTRIASLLDANSFVEIGGQITARSTDFNLSAKETPSDGVITGYGVIDGSLVYVYSQDATVLNGTVGEMHAKKIARLYDFAMKTGAPVIGLIDCAGMRLQEATDAADKSKRCDSTDHRYLRNLWRRNGYDSGTDRLYSDGREKSKIICQFSKRHRRK